MLNRILTALVMAPLAFWIIGWAPEWLFLLVLLATVERGLYEFYSLSGHAGFKTVPVIGYVAGGGLCLAQAAEIRWPGTLGSYVLLALVLAVLLTLTIGLRWPSEPKHFLSATAATIFGVFYIGFTLSWLVPLRFSVSAGGRNPALFLFLVIIFGDIFALFVGRAVGRTPLCPQISPKKTVEGAMGGLLGSLMVAWVFAHWFWQTEPMKNVILYAGVIAVMGQVGDLAESAIKRAGDVKDSGTLLPGHGGLLDRIDSLVLAVPALWMIVGLGTILQ
ncbi:MAG TPA: phosphatidate cytidylyltransferase [Terriglobia bacterium]|nr:phosphatidate cytidylyltransferase [Terriglobia bacterium]